MILGGNNSKVKTLFFSNITLHFLNPKIRKVQANDEREKREEEEEEGRRRRRKKKKNDKKRKFLFFHFKKWQKIINKHLFRF
jgi:hypothetical protein